MACAASTAATSTTLQWVHGPRTVVMWKVQVAFSHEVCASMGPRSEDRGDGRRAVTHPWHILLLQWVHGPRTVVMHELRLDASGLRELQWVHGPRTVVMAYNQLCHGKRQTLQWVHGPRTVVMGAQRGHCSRAGAASMGPRSEDRGDGRVCAASLP